MKLFIGFFLSLLIFFCLSSVVNAQVVINEFSPSEEWVELYSFATTDIDLSGWALKDSVNTPKLLSGTIAPGGFFVYENSSNWLNNDTDTITLIRADGTTHTISYGQTGGVCQPDSNTKSIGSLSDGQASIEKFDRFSVYSMKDTNSKGQLHPCSAPTATATATPTPTSTPSPTPTSTPTKTPTPTAKPTVKPLAKATASATPEVLSTQTQVPSPSSSPTVEPDEGEKKPLPVLPIVLIVFGIGFIGFSGFTFLKNFKKRL